MENLLRKLLGMCALWAWVAATHAEGDTVRLTLDDCIATARRQSVDGAVALGELKAAYWEWRSYKADWLPEVSLSARVPTYDKRYSAYQREDGTHSYVRNDYMELDGSLHVSQRIGLTGGTLSVESSLDWLRQTGGDTSGGRDQFMSMPVAMTFSQPLFGVNTAKWSRRIEPLRYREAKASFLAATEQVAMRAISLFFNLLLAKERVNIAEQNLLTAEKLCEVALAKREMGSISQNDVLQMRLNMLTARSALTTSESDWKARMFELKAFLDVEDDIEPEVPDVMPDVVLPYDEVLQKALENNAFASTVRRRQLEADYSVARAKGDGPRETGGA